MELTSVLYALGRHQNAREGKKILLKMQEPAVTVNILGVQVKWSISEHSF